MGVWIETDKVKYYTHAPIVTPYVGVWIETIYRGSGHAIIQSLLMWECGLKPHPVHQLRKAAESLLMWECGLKQRSYRM